MSARNISHLVCILLFLVGVTILVPPNTGTPHLSQFAFWMIGTVPSMLSTVIKDMRPLGEGGAATIALLMASASYRMTPRGKAVLATLLAADFLLYALIGTSGRGNTLGIIMAEGDANMSDANAHVILTEFGDACSLLRWACLTALLTLLGLAKRPPTAPGNNHLAAKEKP